MNENTNHIAAVAEVRGSDTDMYSAVVAERMGIAEMSRTAVDMRLEVEAEEMVSWPLQMVVGTPTNTEVARVGEEEATPGVVAESTGSGD